MLLTVHLLAVALYAVLLTPLWSFLGLKFAIWLAHLRGGPEGWLANAERILTSGSCAPPRRASRRARRGLSDALVPHASPR